MTIILRKQQETIEGRLDFDGFPQV